MNDIDQLLENLRDAEVDPRLEEIDTAVLAGLIAGREHAMRRSLALTSILALGVGLVASMVSPQRAQAEHVVALNALPPDAPSSLLLGEY